MDEQKNFLCCHDKTLLLPILIYVLTILLAVSTVYIGAGAWNRIKQGPAGNNGTISVSGFGEVYAKPDLAIVSFSVLVEKPNVSDALSANSEKMNAVIDAVKKAGVDTKDLKTVNFSIYPQYDYINAEPQIYPYPPGKRVLSGYEVTQTLQVKIRDLGKIGAIIQAATDEGANEVGDLQLTIENEDALKKQARDEAIKKAKTQAKELAAKLGIRLVRIISFNENQYFPYYSYEATAAKGLGGGSSAPQIETGQNQITSTVTITYEVK